MSKIPLQGNGMAAIPKRGKEKDDKQKETKRGKEKNDKQKEIDDEQQTYANQVE